MDSLLQIAVLIAALGSGLIAGVFFAFSTFVMRALARLIPQDATKAMQEINITVINPWFLGVFMGLAPLCLFLGGVSIWRMSAAGSVFLLSGSILYLVGTFLETVVVHIPMNDALAVVETGTEDADEHWRSYVSRWTVWNHVRTIAALLAAAAFTLALWS